MTVDQLTTSFIHCVKKVQCLTLEFKELNLTLLTDSELQFIANWINNSNLGLKQLEICDYDIPNIPIIPTLESLTIANTHTFCLNGLNISTYSNLRRLILCCVNIEDISSLDGIHELHSDRCDEIRDISSLNHNYMIIISECVGIIDYSNSFRYSEVLEIFCPQRFTGEPIKGFDLSKAMEARKICFGGEYHNKPLLLPQSSSLHAVEVENLEGSFILPSEHNIRRITVGPQCSHVTSLLHFDRIYSVTLVGLRISSLEGLGSGNRVIEVDNCPLITDFSPLRHCDKVTIRNCKGFQDINQVRGVKDLIFCPCFKENIPTDMEGVTCMIFARLPDNLLSLKFPSTLKKLVFTLMIPQIKGLIPQLPFLLAGPLHHVEKIEILAHGKIVHPFLNKIEEFFPDFIIEFKKGIHFLRKLG